MKVSILLAHTGGHNAATEDIQEDIIVVCGSNKALYKKLKGTFNDRKNIRITE